MPTTVGGGRYTVQRFLGEGGKKRAYLAHDERLDRDVVVALIKTDGLDEAGLTRVRREAQAMGRLGDHPNIVTVYDIGEDDVQPYIVSQYMDGGDLQSILHEMDESRLPTVRAVALAEQVCLGLEHAHERGVVHRDLKPGNVWLGRDGTPKLGDFGLAISLDHTRLTQQGMMVGTVAYMPPEQALGRNPDARSDLYALGAMLYEMVAGKPPFLGEDAVAIISQHINTPPVAPTWHNPKVPQPLEALILRLLSKDLDERPRSAGDVAAELRRIGEGIRAQESATSTAVEQPAAVPAPPGEASIWGQFVGRREELNRLKEALDNALSGRGSLVMLVGEPGIGKTRLSDEFAVHARLRGFQVLTGRSYEGEVEVPYLPFVEALRRYTRSRSDAELRQELGAGAPEVATLVSDVRTRFADLPELPRLEADAERLRLFESLRSFLSTASAVTPLLVILDDLHWADKPSLSLLRYLARGLGGERIVFLGTYRDVELDRTHPLAETVAALRREPIYQRILLRGLPENDVVALLAALGQTEVDDESAEGRRALAAALYQETEGNPFFVREVLRHLVDEGKIYRDGKRWTTNVTSVSELGIPEGVREVVGRRLSRLGPACNEMLTLASTMTRGFSWQALRAASGKEEAELLDLLDEALQANLIFERKGDEAGTYDFTHALVRQTLYEELSTPRRVLLHRQIGLALEELYASNPRPHFAELAYHFFQAAPGGDVDKAVQYAVGAGEGAVALAAHEEAVGHYERATQALDLSASADDARRCDLLMRLGEAQWSAGEDFRKPRDSFKRAAELARRLKDTERLSEAALGFAGPSPAQLGTVNQESVDLLREAEACQPPDSTNRPRLLSVLAREFYSSPEQRERYSGEAVAVAERLNDNVSLGHALLSRVYSLWRPEDTKARLAAATQVVDLARTSGDRNLSLVAYATRTQSALELGDIETVDADLENYTRLADELRQQSPRWAITVFRAMRALMSGRFEEGEKLAQEALEIGQRTENPNFLATFAVHLSRIRGEQGRLDELEGPLKDMVAQNPTVVAWRARLADIYCELDRDDEARRELEILAENDFADVPKDFTWLLTISYLTQVAAHLGDLQRCAQLYEILAPHADLVVCVASTACNGSASRQLGLAAAALSRWEDSERHFQDALTVNERMKAPPLVARTQLDYGRMLLGRGADGDRDKGLGFVNQALDTARELGMQMVMAKALALKLEAQGVESGSLETSIDSVASVVRRDKPDLAPHAAPDGTVTIMFSDMQGFTAMTERLGDLKAREVIREHNRLVREQLTAHGGFEVELQGDGFLLAFGSARRALQCAIALQRALEVYNRDAAEPIRVRIGLHTGEALKDADKFFGKTVILAARIAAEAKGEQILVSGILKELTQSAGDIRFGSGCSVSLKGISESQRVFEVEWSESPLG